MRCRGEDLVFTKGICLRDEGEHECPLGKSDCDVLRFKLDNGMDMVKGDTYKEEKLNYAKANYNHLREFFSEMDWSVVYQEADIESKYDKFMDAQNTAVERFVPYHRMKTKKKTVV
ncbi:hypothetical protein E2C01_057579 [Portunus trituberculatus]|uniref:Uncharacterized protein n=1 Tax=Portunus trituberculatus TaxID=210409 RepID=A0A5B7GTW7_PORTR|nr:hypothetical protein [Portunus trituberculatus]